MSTAKTTGFDDPEMRTASLDVPSKTPASDEAAVGVARLALFGIGMRSQP
jgi:hypothetical protein